MSNEALLDKPSAVHFTNYAEPEMGAAAVADFVVVGERIGMQFEHPSVISISMAEKIVSGWCRQSPPLTLRIGQGMPYARLRHLYEQGRRHGNVRLIPETLANLASPAMTHKHVSENIVVSCPVEAGDGTYRAQLMLDERCAEISDHLTGQHVPGMLIAEAGRQMLIAVSESYLLDARISSVSRFLTNRMDIQYRNFVLPVATSIRFIPVAVRRAGPHNVQVKCEIEFIQDDSVCVKASFDYTILSRAFIEAHEKKLAEKLLDQACQ